VAGEAGGKSRQARQIASEFATGSIEAELAAIGKAVPSRDWAKLPADYFARLDHYLHGAPNKK